MTISEPQGFYPCPLCEVQFPLPKLQYSSGAVTNPGLPTQALEVDLTVQYQSLRTLEAQMDTHLRTHPPAEWVPALMEARLALGTPE